MAGISARFSNFAFVSGNIEILGKQNSLFPKGPVIKCLICHVRYIIILTWIWAFQDKLLYLMVFSLYSSLFWEFRDKRNFKKIHFWPESLGATSEYWYIERGQTQSHVCARHFFFVVKYFFLTRLPARITVCLWSRNVHKQQSERSEIFIFSGFYRCPVYR